MQRITAYSALAALAAAATFAAETGAGSGSVTPSKPVAKTPKLVSIIVVRGVLHTGDGSAPDEHGPGARLKLPEGEAKGLLARGVVRLPDPADSADPA